MMIAIPGAEGFFSHLQAALVSNKRNRVRVNAQTRDELTDWEWLADNVMSRPTSIAEVVQKPGTVAQATDAAAPGMGGVVFDLFRVADAPIVWREPFTPDVQACLVSWGNPGGDITNSDLELAGVIGGHDVAAHEVNVRHRNISTLCDNTPAVAWTLRGSVSQHAAVAYLLRLFALHRRQFCYTSTIAHVAGDLNSMADDASRY